MGLEPTDNRMGIHMKNPDSPQPGSFSRRTFIKSLGTTAVATAATQAQVVAAELEKVNGEKVLGPGAVPVTLNVNGETLKLQLEPRTTLLDALRNYSSLTGAKEGCDRATCGACERNLRFARARTECNRTNH